MTRNALGRGLSALIPGAEVSGPVGGETVRQIGIELLDPNPGQPRKLFADEALDELARSIEEYGIIQPLVVRANGDRFQIVAGERRWRAAQRAGLHEVPAIVRKIGDESAVLIALVENLQREDLNPMDEALALDRLMTEFDLTQEEAAAKTGKERATIANSVRLLRLDPLTQELVAAEKISPAHGRTLLAIENPIDRYVVAQQVITRGLTVRQLEEFIKRQNVKTKAKAKPTYPSPMSDPNVRQAVVNLKAIYGTQIYVTQHKSKKSGTLVFEYYNPSDLMRIYEVLARGTDRAASN